jgi:hypothetical protein
MPEYLFISYSHKDSSFIKRLKNSLERDGYAVWFDQTELEVGNKWRGKIVGAIKAANAFVLVLSPTSVDSDEVSKELSLAAKHKIPIFPILLGNTEISDALAYQLADLQYITLEENYDDTQFQALIRGLKCAGIQPQHLRVRYPTARTFRFSAGRANSHSLIPISAPCYRRIAPEYASSSVILAPGKQPWATNSCSVASKTNPQ